MAIDDFRVIVFQPSQGDEPLPFLYRAAVARSEALGIGINRWNGVVAQDSACAPIAKMLGSAGVYIVLCIFLGFAATEDNAYEVVRAGRVIALLHLRRDLVVRLRDYL